ncbi:MAG TPA: glycosyltransferase [Candidatus Bathyarchaeia archaeon]|nr:glycosyltransferase [Candidatus Bathyarchaeia archaeon]
MISVVIPAHNEADEIGGLLAEFATFKGLELIIAEDASTDGTSEIVQEFASHSGNVTLSRSPVLTGKGAAVRRGLALATGDVLGFIDGDASIHPSDFMRVAGAITQGADLALGSRRLRESIVPIPQPLSRRLSGAVYRTLARVLLDTSVRDFQCGCKTFRREVWDACSVTCDGFAFDAELIAKAHHAGFKIVEVPITWSNKTNSKVNVPHNVLPMLRCLLQARAALRR